LPQKEAKNMDKLREVVIVDGCRTAVGSMGGALKPLHAVDLACTVLKGTLDRTGIDPKVIDEVIMGQCRQTSDEPNIARVAALRVGIPDTTPAYTVMRQCAPP
jgi:acetyl-CoA C-acetyltransferase